jgi:hypothetical protein
VKRAVISLGLALAALAALPSHADVGPPAHLRITEREPGLIVTQWRVPKVLPPRAVPVPDLPETCEPEGEYSVEEQAYAWLFTREWRCERTIAGEPVGMRWPLTELALTTVIRVHLLSGDRFAHVLTPGEGEWQLPKGTAAPDRLRDAARAVLLGAAHVWESWAHWPFVLVIGLLGGIKRSIRVVTAFTLGQLLGMLTALPAPDLGAPPAEIAVGITAALLAREALRPAAKRRRLVAVAGIGGAIHGLTTSSLIAGSFVEGTAGIVTQLLALLGMDAAHLVAAAVVVTLVALVAPDSERAPTRRGVAYLSGATGIALAIGVALGGGTVEPEAERIDVAGSEEIVAASGTKNAVSRRLAPATPDAPIQSFLVIEPFEVRHEAMLRLAALVEVFGLAPDAVIGEFEQAALTERLAAFVRDSATVQIDGRDLLGVSQRAYFMAVDATGALPRTVPEPEKVSEAVVGVVISYPTEGIPDEVTLRWSPFPTALESLPAITIDPESVAPATLSAGEPALNWENRLAEDPVPTVDAVVVEPARLPVPLVSLPLLAVAVVLLIRGLRRRQAEATIAITRVLLAVALIAGPIARTTVALPASGAGTPSERQARRILAGLLPNIYRAMEYRDEMMIYDQLAVSVTGETLTDVYLQQRRMLEMEERGGAQARVGAVEVLEVSRIERLEQGYGVLATWTAAGMVTHFGHRHFRQNRYNARIEFVPVDGQWKIRSVEILEQDRLQ